MKGAILYNGRFQAEIIFVWFFFTLFYESLYYYFQSYVLLCWRSCSLKTFCGSNPSSKNRNLSARSQFDQHCKQSPNNWNEDKSSSSWHLFIGNLQEQDYIELALCVLSCCLSNLNKPFCFLSLLLSFFLSSLLLLCYTVNINFVSRAFVRWRIFLSSFQLWHKQMCSQE